ncbi:MAG: S1 RNA-binding domain-containing protein [Halobacteriales archaeon]|nr:S1 RNA-binding domain-containing protein [Halobacteriales archaeon]
MGTCVICGTDVDGHVCTSHEEDVCFEFTGSRPNQLTPSRFYQGSVDGYAEFGVFVDIGDHVTGLLHRSELPRRLESLDWEPGDEVYVQVTNVRDNGNVDLSWSIRQAPEEFRDRLIQTPQGDDRPEVDEPAEDEAGNDSAASAADATSEPSASSNPPEGADAGVKSSTPFTASPGDEAPEPVEETGSDGGAELVTADETDDGADDELSTADETGDAGADEPEPDPAPASEASSEPEPLGGGAVMESPLTRSEVAGLVDEIGSPVRIEGEVVDVRQTSGPTIFEVRDETGVVDCAAFKSAGVRAYPDVEAGDLVRVDGLVEDHRGDVQVESEALEALEGDERDAIADRLDAALAERAAPEGLQPLADHGAVKSVSADLLDAATAIRRAVFEARPVVIRHRSRADGYVAAAALEHAILPMVRSEHDANDAVYHYVDRRPVEDRVYGLSDAIRDVTRLLDAEERHGEKTPLFVFVGAGSTAESVDALDLLGVYGAERIVVDGGFPDEAAADAADGFVSPHLAGAADAETATSAALCATLATAVNPDVREDVRHLPAVSYWGEAPAAYTELAAEAGYDESTVAALREAVGLESFYQVYEDKRQLIADLLFGDASLAEPASEQFRARLDEAVRTAEPHLDDWSVNGASLGVLDVDAYTHQYDFPPADVLLWALAEEAGDLDAVIGADADELVVWSREPVDLRAVAEAVQAAAPAAGAEVRGGRDGTLIFLSGERDAVLEAAISAVAERL